MGVPMKIGTGLFKLVHKSEKKEKLQKRSPIFDDPKLQSRFRL